MATKLVTLEELSKIINGRSLSFESIKDDILNKFIAEVADGQVWKDSFYKTSDGRIIVNLIAGLAAFKAYHEISKVRESSLDHANVDTNVFNKAADKGYLIPPVLGPQFTFKVKLDATSTDPIIIKKEEIVAILGNYYFYSLDNYTISSQIETTPIKLVYGYLNEFTQLLDTKGKNDVFEFKVRDKYVASQLEGFYADTIPIELTSDSSIYSDISKVLLRRILYYTSKVYLGNGTLGYYDANANEIKYKIVSYGEDINDKIDNTPILAIDRLIVDERTLTIAPGFEPKKEQVRNIARYYPIDGRIVRDEDYKAVLLKYFGAYVYDILSFNSNTDQELYLLTKPNFTTEIQNEMDALIESRMALGIRKNFYIRTINEGASYTFKMKVKVDDYIDGISNKVSDFLEKKKYVFFDADTQINVTNICVELSSEFGVEFYPVSGDTLQILKGSFIRAFNFTIETFNG